MPVIEVVTGDITREQTEAIVTAANESLLGGGGVDGDQAARIAVATLRATPTSVRLIRLVAFDEATRELLEHELAG